MDYVIGAGILLIGMGIGFLIAVKTQRELDKLAPKEKPYDKYRNENGLYTRKTMKG